MAITEIWTHRIAQPAASDFVWSAYGETSRRHLVFQPLVAGATVGITQSATTRARWSWSTLPSLIPISTHQVNAGATTQPAIRGNRLVEAMRQATISTKYRVVVFATDGFGRSKSLARNSGW